MTSVLVIGAGIGGIVTAARLARHGYQVTVIEKGERAGVATAWSRMGTTLTPIPPCF